MFWYQHVNENKWVSWKDFYLRLSDYFCEIKKETINLKTSFMCLFNCHLARKVIVSRFSFPFE